MAEDSTRLANLETFAQPRDTTAAQDDDVAMMMMMLSLCLKSTKLKFIESLQCFI